MKRKLMIVLVVIAVVIIVAVIGISVFVSQTQKSLDSLADLPVSEVDMSTLSDGVYDGSYSAFPIVVEVRVTVEEHRIAAIDILKHQTGQGQPAEAITGTVMEKQSLKVDAVSGATYSSKVILKAIENALDKAKNN